jgi:hypothetical protein
MTTETGLLQDAVREITFLRKENEIMRTRLDMFDSMMLVLTASVTHQSIGMSPDIVWEIEKFIESQNKTNQP